MKNSLSKILLRRDSRLFNYDKVFGSTTDFPTRLFADAGLLEIQQPGNVMCTAFATTNVASAITGKDYDQIALWADMQGQNKVMPNGADPVDAFSVAVKSGLHVVPTGEIEKPAIAYFQVELGHYDFFTNVKSYMTLEWRKGHQRIVAVGTPWAKEWLWPLSDTVLPEGTTSFTNHEWIVTGWDDELHPNCFRIDWFGGRYNWVTQVDFNKAMDALYGTKALGFAATSAEHIEALKSIKISLLSKALDLCYNIIILWTPRLSRR